MSEGAAKPDAFQIVREAVAREQEERKREHNTLRGRGTYSAETRDLVLAHARARIRAGAKLREIASQLGVSRETLLSWMGPTPEDVSAVVSPPRLRPVTIIPQPGEPLPAVSGPTVILPSGVRICGLSMDQAIELARVLK